MKAILLALLTSLAYVTLGQGLSHSRNLSASERTALTQALIEKHAFTIQGFADPHTARVYLTSAVGVSDSPSRPTRKFVLTFYSYEAGETLEVVLDAKTKAVDRAQNLGYFPTPLAPEEMKRALTLIYQGSPKLSADVSASKLTIDYVVISRSAKADPLYKHRFVKVLFAGAGRSRSFDVDLTTEHVLGDQKQ